MFHVTDMLPTQSIHNAIVKVCLIPTAYIPSYFMNRLLLLSCVTENHE